MNFEQLKSYASQLQGKTLFGDEKILNDSTAQLLTFTNIAGENFKRTQAVALDLATVLDGDLKSASIQLRKALNAFVNNLSALSRSGIQFSDEHSTETERLFDKFRGDKAIDNEFYEKERRLREEINQARIITYVDQKKNKLISLLTNDMESDPSEIIEIYRK